MVEANDFSTGGGGGVCTLGGMVDANVGSDELVDVLGRLDDVLLCFLFGRRGESISF